MPNNIKRNVGGFYLGPRENTEGEIDHLEILGTGDRGKSVGPGTDIENERLLEPRNQKMGAFTDGSINYSTESIEKHSALASIDGVKGGVKEGGAGTEADSSASNIG